jgi:drug/metabolite transporter (DMT)-like permease
MPVILRLLTTSVDPWTANGIRYPFAALLYWPFLFQSYRAGLITAPLLRRCLIPAFFAFGGQIFWAQAPYYLPATSIGFFVRMSTVWALVAAMVLFREERRLLRSAWFWTGMVASFVGFVAFAVEGGALDFWLRAASTPAQLLNAQSAMTGVLIMSACSLFFGFYGISVKACLSGESEWLTFGLVCQFVSIGTLLGVALFGGKQGVQSLDSKDWGLMLFSSVVGIGIGHVFLYNAIRLLGAALSSVLQTLMPLITFSLAWLVLGEGMGPNQCAAGAVMLVGALCLVASQRSARP